MLHVRNTPVVVMFLQYKEAGFPQLAKYSSGAHQQDGVRDLIWFIKLIRNTRVNMLFLPKTLITK